MTAKEVKEPRPIFVLYTAATNHANVQPPTWGALFFREHVDNGQWGPSSSYWMVPCAYHD